MALRFVAVVRKNLIPTVQFAIMENTVNAVREGATFTRDTAATFAPVDTGSFQASLYVNGPDDETDYPESVTAALDLNDRVNTVDEIRATDVDPKVPTVSHLGRKHHPHAIVASAVEHALYLEEGTVNMAPQPTFRPAALIGEHTFKELMMRVADGF